MTVFVNKPYQYDYPRPMVTVDMVVFTVASGRLEVLLIERGGEPFRGAWALPGGFVEIEEDLEPAACRELMEETGLRDLFIEQLYTFGRLGRDPRGRTISVTYYALIPSGRKKEAAGGDDAVQARWFGMEELPDLAFDHADIISCGRCRLQGKLRYTTAGFKLLAETFTLTELQQVYEVVWGKALDRRNFRKWILGRKIIEATDETVANGPHRPARLYRLIEQQQDLNSLLVFD